MKLLVVMAMEPSPPWSGYQIRCLEILRRLAERHEIVACCAGKGREPTGEWARLVSSTRMVPLPRTTPATLARSLFSSEPHHVATHATAEMREAVGAELARGVDAILAHYLYFAPCLPPRGATRRPTCVLDQQNVDHEVWETYAEHSRLPLAGRYFRRQARLMERFERAHLPLFDVVLSVSEEDAAATRAILPAAASTEVVLAANGVDLRRIRPAEAKAPGPPTVVFTGTSARRNVDALRWFLGRCWPAVRARVPDARFVVAGKLDPTHLPAGLRSQQGVSFTGPLDRIEEALVQAHVAIVPVRMGGGTKIKAVEAMAAGLPTVVVPEAARGLGARDGHELLVRDDPAAYVDAVVDLLVDDVLRRRVGAAARAHAERHHDWDAIAGVVERALLDGARDRRDVIGVASGP